MTINEKLYFNGDILTLEDELYTEAVLVKGRKIYKVGKKEKVYFKEANDNVELIDLQGKTLMPSFIDAHSHFAGYASSYTQVDLTEVISFDEIVEAIQKFIKKNNIPEGKWIQANGYDQNFLDEKIHPTKELLDKAAPNNPVVAKHKSGHMGVLNTIGIKALGITIDTPDPEGGSIEKKNGEVTGYLEETAFVNYVQEIPIPSTEEFVGNFLKAQDAYASYGITTAQEGMVVDLLVDIYQYLIHSKSLKIDLIGYLDINNSDVLKQRFANCLQKYDNHVKMGGYKTFLDGSPQGRTAWLRKPYEGDEEYYAYGTQSDEKLKGKSEKALKENMQILVHCNGDRACQQYIDQYKVVKKDSKIDNDIRPVIVHAQLLSQDQLDDVKALNMIPSFFVAHVYHWGA